MAAPVRELVLGVVRRAAALTSLRDPEGRRAARDMLKLLQEQDARLARILRRESLKFGVGTARFTGAAATAYREQIRVAIDFVQARLLGFTNAQAARAATQGLDDTVRLLSGLERRFRGLVVPLRLRQAEIMQPLRRGVLASLMRQHATSTERYGLALVGKFERTIRGGLISGASMDDMVGALTGHGGPRGLVNMRSMLSPDGTVLRVIEHDIPEGLFTRHRYWAERIVRTETAHAYEEARLEGMYEERGGEVPDLQKKILAHFDSRTAWDSIAVHGQVRKLEEYFMDGAGRQYLRPPARPHDRETVIPWRPAWPEVEETRSRTATEQSEAIAQSTRAAGQQRAAMASQGARIRRDLAARRAQERTARARERLQARIRERAAAAGAR